MLIHNQDIDNGRAFDWGRASEDYAKYRDVYPPEFFERIAAHGLCTKGQKVLDLGTGTGVLPRGMYRFGASFTGADISENQIAYAKALSENAGMDIDYIVSAAEDLDFPNGSFDVVTACQCFQYFDKPRVLPKIHDLLRDGGHFCVLFMGWETKECGIAEYSERLVLKYNPEWTGAGWPRPEPKIPDWLGDLFEPEDIFVYDLDVPFTRESWNGRIKACRGIGPSLPPERIAEFEAEHVEYLKTLPESFIIPHWAWVTSVRKNNMPRCR